MNKVYVIKDSKSNYPVATAFDEGTAIATVKHMNSIQDINKYNYMLVPFFYEPGTQFNIIAPPISKEYLPWENNI